MERYGSLGGLFTNGMVLIMLCTSVREDGKYRLVTDGIAHEFAERAKAHELLLVPSDGFGTPGWVRAGYCCSEQTIRGALVAFQELWDEYHA